MDFRLLSRHGGLPKKTAGALLLTITASMILVASLLIDSPSAGALTIYASDTYNRTVANGWGTADSGGGWTVAAPAANWSVTPGAGSISVPANGQLRGYLGAVAVQDVEVTAKIVLPRSTQSNNSIMYLLGRDSGAGGTYYRVGLGQGTGSTMILRAQRENNASLSPDLATGIAAANGAVVWLRVQFEGVNPTSIRARAWLDGTAEPSTWLLNVTDSNAAQQIAGAVGARARNEDTAAAHAFAIRSFTATSFPPSPTPTPTATPPPPGPLATDTYGRTTTGGWGNADLGGLWTTLGSPWNWSVSSGAGTIAAAANADERGYLSAVNTRDVDVTAQVVLPRSGQANNALAYVLGRYVAAYNPTYYAVGVGQGTGANIILRAQRSGGTAIGTDLNTGIAAADGATVWLHVQFQGGSPTAIRARAWLDGTAEPSTWLLNTTDSNAAQQVAGAVGIRARNEDTASARTFRYRNFQAFGTAIATAPITPNPAGGALRHLLYVAPDRGFDVFDIDNNHALLKHVNLPSSGVLGIAVSSVTGMLYLSECGSDCDPPDFGGQILKYDLVHDVVVWVAYYPSFGVDSISITPDGQTMYSPDGESSSGAGLHVLNAVSGALITPITANVAGHNSVVGLDGTHAYLGGYQGGSASRYLQQIDTATNTITKQIGQLRAGVRPFTINGTQTLAFTTASNFLGFEVSSITTGQLLYTVPVAGFSYTSFITDAPSHGITMSPDEREVYVVDGPNSYVHVFDITGLPGSPPVQVADIPVTQFSGNSSPCAARCEREGWLMHSGDGRFMYVGDSGDVIDTAARTAVVTLNTLRNTRKFIEVDWQDGAPVFTTTRHGLGYVGAPTVPPAPTATATGTRTSTFTPSPTGTPTPSSTTTSTASSTSTPTSTPTATNTPSATATNTATPTSTASSTSTRTSTPTATNTPSATATNTATSVPTSTDTPTATSTTVPTSTDTATTVPTSTQTPTLTSTTVPTATNTATSVPTAADTPTATSTTVPTATDTATSVPPTHTATPTETPTSVPTATDTATGTPTTAPAATDTPAPEPTTTETATSIPTATHTSVPPTDTATSVPTDTGTPAPTDTNTPTATSTPVATATDTPTSTDTPAATDTATPTDTATSVPTNTATSVPTATDEPTSTDTATPSTTATPLNNAMAVDAVPSTAGTVDSEITIAGGGNFSVAINVTGADIAYKGYQVEIEFPNAGLDFAGTTAPNGSSPFQLCQLPNNVFAGSVEFVQDACAKSSPGSVAYLGQVETIDLKCASLGTFTIHMTLLTADPQFGSTTLDGSSTAIPTLTADASVTCAPPNDSDGDGCPDVRETALATDWHTGAERDASSPWDFFDVPRPIATDPTPDGTRDGAINLADAIASLAYVGTHAGDTGSPNAAGVTYDSTKDGDWFNLSTGKMGADGIIGPEDAVGRRFDRTASSDPSKPWQTGAPNAAVNIGDVLIQLNSIPTNCS